MLISMSKVMQEPYKAQRETVLTHESLNSGLFNILNYLNTLS